MTTGQVTIVRILKRRPTSTQWSVERIFSDIASVDLDGFHLEVIEAPYSSRGIFRRLACLLWAFRLRDTVCHIAGDIHFCALALRRDRSVLTILDLIPMRRLAGVRRIAVKWLWYVLPVWWVKRVTVISASTRDELVQLLPWAVGKITVVPCPVSTQFQQAPRPRRPVPVVLQVGTAEHKNLAGVSAALMGSGTSLRVVGRLTSEQCDMLAGHGIRYSALSDLDEAGVALQYRDADLLTFVSTYEGFGLPILEAQATGRPVVTSTVASMPEVAGGAALLVDPWEPDAIREAIEQILANPSEYERLVAAGFQNVKRYSPQAVAEQYAAVYEAVGDRVEKSAEPDVTTPQG